MGKRLSVILFDADDATLFKRLRRSYTANIVTLVSGLAVLLFPVILFATTERETNIPGLVVLPLLVGLLLVLELSDLLFWKYVAKLKGYLDSETIELLAASTMKRKISSWRVYKKLRSIAKNEQWI